MKSNKKGQLMGGPVGQGISVVFGLFLVGILVFAIALAGGSMSAATTDATAKGVIGNVTSGASQFAAFTPILWIMAGIGILIGIVVLSIGAYMFYRTQGQ